MPGHVANEIGQEDERAFEDGDNVQIVREVVADLESHRRDALLNLVGRE